MGMVFLAYPFLSEHPLIFLGPGESLVARQPEWPGWSVDIDAQDLKKIKKR